MRSPNMRSPLLVAVVIAAIPSLIPSLALAQASPPSPPPPAAPAPPAASPPPAHANTPHANAHWNADRFSFDYDDGGCHFVYDYDFKNGDMHLDRHGDCSSVSIPHP
jgi:hypothetical protein